MPTFTDLTSGEISNNLVLSLSHRAIVGLRVDIVIPQRSASGLTTCSIAPIHAISNAACLGAETSRSGDARRINAGSSRHRQSLIAPLIPPPKRGGNKRTIVERDVVDGLMYILSTGCQWSALA
jgi:hypothetical protein